MTFIAVRIRKTDDDLYHTTVQYSVWVGENGETPTTGKPMIVAEEKTYELALKRAEDIVKGFESKGKEAKLFE